MRQQAPPLSDAMRNVLEKHGTVFRVGSLHYGAFIGGKLRTRRSRRALRRMVERYIPRNS